VLFLKEENNLVSIHQLKLQKKKNQEDIKKQPKLKDVFETTGNP
jgi:hypothetical protein